MKPLVNFVNEFISRTHDDWQLKLRAEWSVIMGSLSERARLERINGTTLVIGVYDTHWMHELHALSRMILAKVNTALAPVYPQGFMLTTLRCIWVTKKTKKSNNALLDHEKSQKVINPSQAMIQEIKKNAPSNLIEPLIAYYVRCKKEQS